MIFTRFGIAGKHESIVANNTKWEKSQKYRWTSVLFFLLVCFSDVVYVFVCAYVWKVHFNRNKSEPSKSFSNSKTFHSFKNDRYYFCSDILMA